jgi:hypothetical protein
VTLVRGVGKGRDRYRARPRPDLRRRRHDWKAFVALIRRLQREIQLATGSGETSSTTSRSRVAPYHFTDSNRAVLYRVGLTKNGRRCCRERPSADGRPARRRLQLNGIDATPDGKTLIVVQSATGKPAWTLQTGLTKAVDLAGATPRTATSLPGAHAYVVQNQLNRIAVVSFAKGLAAGGVTRTITNPAFDVPTTIDRGERIYAVNARLRTTPGPTTYCGSRGRLTFAGTFLAHARKWFRARDSRRGADA